MELNPHDWQKYAFFDDYKNYTRNLIATDHETFTLLLLCWTPNKESPIHDHPCDGCWVKVLEGQVRECRYKHMDDTLVCFQDETFAEGELSFIQDSQGYHKIGNPSLSERAVTLHLYCPPFAQCKIWLDETKPSSKSCVCFYSEYGQKVEY